MTEKPRQLKHPGKTKAQRDALDQMGCGAETPRAHSKTLAALVERGLIVRLSDKVVGRDALGVVAIPRYEMTAATHMDWCAYQAQQYDGSERHD